tara:strand:+ start:4673 stop:5545 length:873 start_codon:yes stop_codon:yes gene_type:complete
MELTIKLEPFPSKKVMEIVPIAKIKGATSSLQHETATVISGTEQRFSLPVLKTTGRLMQLFEPEIQAKLEKALGLKEGDMNVTAMRPDQNYFWNYNYVSLDRGGKKFDLSNPIEYIQYAICAAQPKIAKTTAEIQTRKAEFDFFFLDKSEKAASENVSMDIEMDAAYEAKTLSKDYTGMIKFFKVYTGKAPDKAWDKEQLKNAIFKLVKTNPKGFLDIVNDKDYEVKLEISEAIASKVILPEGKGAYRLSWADKGDYLATNKKDLIEWFNDPLNSKTKLQIQAKVVEVNK